MARGRKKKDKDKDPKNDLPMVGDIPFGADKDSFRNTDVTLDSVDNNEPENIIEQPNKKRYFVAKNRSVTSKIGIIDEKESRRRGGIDASYFVGGKDTLDDNIRKGVLVAE